MSRSLPNEAIAALQIVLALALNAIPVAGALAAHWSPASVLALYWVETVVAVAFMACRIARHRSRTRKRGHERPQLGATVTTGGRPSRAAARGFLGEFLVVGIAFSVAHGIFLAAVFLVILKTWPDRSELATGLTAMFLAQAAAFLLDLLVLDRWSFADLKARASGVVGRVGLMHFALLGGVALAGFSSRPTAVFVVFGSLKALAEITARLPFRLEKSETAPPWIVWLARTTGNGRHWKTGQDIEVWWRETTRAELARDAADELPSS